MAAQWGSNSLAPDLAVSLREHREVGVAHFLNIDDLVLNFDPAAPHARFRAMGRAAEALVAEAALPHPVPWPEGAAPKAAPLEMLPEERLLRQGLISTSGSIGPLRRPRTDRDLRIAVGHSCNRFPSNAARAPIG